MKDVFYVLSVGKTSLKIQQKINLGKNQNLKFCSKNNV